MGSADLYCYICGGATYSRYVITETKLLKDILKTLKKQYDGLNIYDSAENLIELILNNYRKYGLRKITNEEHIRLKSSIKLLKEHSWLDKLLLITKDNEIIKDVISAGEMCVYKDNVRYCPGYDTITDSYIIHCDCYKILKEKYGKITYEMISKGKSTGNTNINHKYQNQFHDYVKAYMDDPWTLESPLKNSKTLKVVNSFKLPRLKTVIKKDRPSPSESATSFPVGTKRKGNDGNMWIVIKTNNSKRWKKIT